jgi:hypothetical protein
MLYLIRIHNFFSLQHIRKHAEDVPDGFMLNVSQKRLALKQTHVLPVTARIGKVYSVDLMIVSSDVTVK